MIWQVRYGKLLELLLDCPPSFSFVFSLKTEYSILLIHILSFIFTTHASIFLRISPSSPTQSFLIPSLPTPTPPTRISLPPSLPAPTECAGGGAEAGGGTHGRTRGTPSAGSRRASPPFPARARGIQRGGGAKPARARRGGSGAA
jgi:hypothetical protein